jgi:hypothetical protein
MAENAPVNLSLRLMVWTTHGALRPARQGPITRGGENRGGLKETARQLSDGGVKQSGQEPLTSRRLTATVVNEKSAG